MYYVLCIIFIKNTIIDWNYTDVSWCIGRYISLKLTCYLCERKLLKLKPYEDEHKIGHGVVGKENKRVGVQKKKKY